MNVGRHNLVLPVCLFLQALAAVFALAPSDEGLWFSARLFISASIVVILPGWLVREQFGVRSRSYLETLAGSFLLSTGIISVLGLAAMSLRLPIGGVVGAIFLLNLTLSLVLLSRKSDGLRGEFVAIRPSEVGLLAVVGFLAFVAYKWGDQLSGVGWETALHVAYIRHYASGLPLDFQASTLRPPEIAPQNYFYLWEFVLATISVTAGLDPLPAALKSRWLLPTLGFSAFYFMVQRLATTSAALRATWVMAIAVLFQFLALPPNGYDMYVEAGPLRQVGAFLGSIHHSDSAMEILLPTLVGTLFWAIRRGSWNAWTCFAAALAIAFLWHPREYFQAMWYGGVAITVDLAAGFWLTSRLSWRQRLFRYGQLIGVYVLVAVALYICLPTSIRNSSEHVAGVLNQWSKFLGLWESLSDGRSWMAGSLPLSFHLHGLEAPNAGASTPVVFSWLVLSIPIAAILGWFGARLERGLALYLLALWLVSLTSYQFGIALEALTYHEILISKPRLVHLFAYAVIGIGWSRLVDSVSHGVHGKAGQVSLIAGYAVLGFAFSAAWNSSIPNFKAMFSLLNAAFFLACMALVVSLRYTRKPLSGHATRPRMGVMFTGIAFAAFLAVPSGSFALQRWKIMLAHELDSSALFGDSNPTGLSSDTVQYFRSIHPHRTRVLIEPGRPHMIGVFAPVYVIPLLGNIGADAAQLQAAAEDRHPVFNSRVRDGKVDANGVLEFCAVHRIDYVLGTGAYVSAFKRLAEMHPDEFTIVFQSSNGQDLIVAMTRLVRSRAQS